MIELKHLATYLPYRINVQIERLKYPIGKEIVELSLKNIDQFDNKKMWKFKPILRPMSDLNINSQIAMSLGIVVAADLDYLKGSPLHYSYDAVQELLSEHFDVFDLLSQNLAISIHDLEK